MQITEVSVTYHYDDADSHLVTARGTVSDPFDDLPERDDVLAFKAAASVADRAWVDDEVVVRADGYFHRSWRVLPAHLSRESTSTET